MDTIPFPFKPRARTGHPASASRRKVPACTRQNRSARPPTSTNAAIQSSCERWLPCVSRRSMTKGATSPAAATPPQNTGARSPVASAAAAGRVPPSAKPHTRYAARHAASSTMSAPSARASHASGRMNGRRASTNAATPSASANAARKRREHEHGRKKRRLPEQHRREPLQKRPGVGRRRQPRRHRHGRKRHSGRPRGAKAVGERQGRERPRADERDGERVGAHGQRRRLRREDQREQPVGAAQVGKDAHDAHGQRHHAHGPGACEELVGKPRAPARERAHAFERRQHHERTASGAAQKEVPYDERVEHAPPSRAAPRTPRVRPFVAM